MNAWGGEIFKKGVIKGKRETEEEKKREREEE